MAGKKTNYTYIGGQAALEGVMMKGKTMYALAVRTPEKGIAMSVHDVTTQKNRFLRLPVVRGVVSFINSLVLGVRIIYDSAEKAGLDDLEEENPSKFDLFLQRKFGDKLFEYVMMFSVILSLALGILIFMLLPTFLAGLLNRFLGGNATILAVLEGITRIIIFLAYIYIVSKTKEIRRVFEYHGAEHKTISCYESGDELTPENAIRHTRLHKRCGTSFLLIVMLVSMIFFMFFPIKTLWLRLGTRILFVPLIAGISYELIMWAGRSDNAIVSLLSKPGLMLQKWTTLEPDLSQIEIAIAAMKAVLYREPPETTVKEALAASSKRLAGYSGTPELDAQLIVSAATSLSRTELITKPDEKLTGNAYKTIDEYCELRKKHTPMAYILGTQDFMEYSFKTDSRVLIPRPDTETLVVTAIDLIEKINAKRIIEIGTGSGCVAICLANKFEESVFFATDISKEAISAAESQPAAQNLENLKFYEGDLFSALPEELELADMIISNPPYIPSAEINTLEAQVREHEPLLALNGGTDGLDFYRRITEDARDHLRAGGILIYETGWNQRDEVVKILEDNGFSSIESVKDLAGKDRVIWGIRSN